MVNCERCNGFISWDGYEDEARCLNCGRGLIQPRVLPPGERPGRRVLTPGIEPNPRVHLVDGRIINENEAEILKRRAEGQTYKAIAEAMGISFHVVANTLRNNRNKSAAITVMEFEDATI